MKSVEQFLAEGKPKTTKNNPLVVIYDKPSKGDDYRGLAGMMHLTTAAKIYRFPITGTLIRSIWNKGTEGRVAVSSPADEENPERWPEKTMWLSLSPFSAPEMKKGRELTQKEIDDVNVAKALIKAYNENVEKLESGEQLDEGIYSEKWIGQFMIDTDRVIDMIMKLEKTYKKNDKKIALRLGSLAEDISELQIELEEREGTSRGN